MLGKIKNSIKKVLSIVLSLNMLAGSFGVSANNREATPEKPISSSKKIERLSKFTKEHPCTTVASLVGAIGVAALGIWGGVVLANNIRYKICLHEVTTAVDNMTDNEVIAYRDKQIGKFKSIGEGKFDVEQKAVDKLPPRILALFMGQINAILKAYPNIFRKYREYVLQKDQFTVSVIDSRSCSNNAVTQYNLSENKHLEINELVSSSSVELFHAANNYSVKTGHIAPCDTDRIVELVVAHEMGHVIHHTLAAGQALCHCPLMPSEVSKISYQDANMRRGKGYTEISYENFVLEPIRYMKEDILKIAKEQFGYVGSGYISKYGKTNDMEWFAEVCAHAFCSKEPNALGKAMLQFLAEQDQKLGEAFAKIDKSQ